MTQIGFGIDLSHFQDPRTLPWESWRGVVNFVLVKGCEGGSFKDPAAAEHLRRARDIGAKVGVYCFFRHEQSVDDHLAMLRRVADECRLDAGDVVPAIDIEKEGGSSVDPSWSASAQALSEGIAATWDDCLIYITQREWRLLGSPSWVLSRPLWVAHYTSAPAPATPAGMPPVIWQKRVGHVDPNGPGGYFANEKPQIDQSVLLQPLPLIGELQSDAEKKRISDLIALNLSEAAQQNWNDNAPPEENA